MQTPFPGWVSPADRLALRPKLSACERLAEVARALSAEKLSIGIDLANPAASDVTTMPLSVFEELGRAVKTFSACLELARTGYGQPAQALAAIVLQSSLIVLWADGKGELADRRANLHARYGLQWDLDQRRRIGLWKGLQNEDYLDAGERQEAKEVFGDKPSGLWTGHASLSDLIDDLADHAEDDFSSRQFLAIGLMAVQASAMAAGSGLSNQAFRVTRQLEDGRDALAVNLGQGPETVADGLLIAWSALISALEVVVNQYAPALKDDLRRAGGLLWRAWKDPRELAGLADDDDCPCDRPGTKWGECHKWTEELGTVEYVPFTDADLVNFTPYDPRRDEPAEIELQGLPSDLPAGPVILTFTFKLPFTLGLLDDGAHSLVLSDTWANPDDTAHFGAIPIARIRLDNEVTDGMDVWPERADKALQKFFGPTEDAPKRDNWPPVPNAYEQWITVETPSGRLKTEAPEDPAYAFHRALSVLNWFLMALDLTLDDWRVRAVSTREIGAVVFRGAWTREGTWVRVGDLIMHPESLSMQLEPQSIEAMTPQLEAILGDLQGGRLFMVSNLWHNRALRAFADRGDYADCVVSLQTATESMMYDLLRGLMVDAGGTASEINSKVSADLPYKSLLQKELAPRLKGNWDLMGSGSVGHYWTSVYMLRNRVVHEGYTPGVRETEEALAAFRKVREYVSQRLWSRFPNYPRTLVAKVGVNGLQRRGWFTKAVRHYCERFNGEPSPFYWPRDVAGR